ncbi:hypothetical protein LTS03_011976, partial [Exophiala xenobiotica]
AHAQPEAQTTLSFSLVATFAVSRVISRSDHSFLCQHRSLQEFWMTIHTFQHHARALYSRTAILRRLSTERMNLSTARPRHSTVFRLMHQAHTSTPPPRKGLSI